MINIHKMSIQSNGILTLVTTLIILILIQILTMTYVIVMLVGMLAAKMVLPLVSVMGNQIGVIFLVEVNQE